MSKSKKQSPAKPTVSAAAPKKTQVQAKPIFTWARAYQTIEPESQDKYKQWFWIFQAIVAIVYLYISKDYGISWDENGHWRIGNANLDYFLSGGKDKTCLDETKHLFSSLLYYGESFNTLTAAICRLFPSLGVFEVRHFLNALVGLLGIMYTGLLAKEMGDWKTGLIASAILAITPVYLGHSMNNPTDIPFAVAGVATIYYLVKLLKKSPSLDWKLAIQTGVALGCALSIRVGALLFFAYVGLFMGISYLIQLRQSRRFDFSTLKNYFLNGITILFVGYVLGIITWPFALQKPFVNPFVALAHSTDPKFFVISYELFEGKKIYMGDAPWYYVLKYMAITVPLGWWFGLLLAPIAYIKQKANLNLWIVGICIFCFLFPIATAIYKDLMVYNAWRHYLFVFPFLVVLMAGGLRFAESLVRFSFAKWVSLGYVMVIFLSLLVWNIQNHPQQYVYFNALVGGTSGAYGKYETDYYSNSVKAAIEWLITNEKLGDKKVLISTNNEVLTAQYYAQKKSDSIQIKWQREGEGAMAPWDYEIITSRTFDPIQFKNGGFPPKGTIHTIDCDGVPLAAVVKKANDYKYQGNQFIEKGNIDSAIVFLEKYAAYDPNDEENFRLLGMAYSAANQSDKAIQVLNKAIELKPTNPAPYTLKGMVYAQSGNTDKALELFQFSAKLRVNFTDAWVYMGNVYMQRKEYYAAASSFEKALTMTNPNPDLMNQTGVAYLNAGNMERALAFFQAIMQNFPNYPYAYQNAAYIYHKSGNQVEANRMMQIAQQLGAR